MLGVLKYPAPYLSIRDPDPERAPRLAKDTSVVQLLDRATCKPPKCYLDTEQDIVEWLLEPLSTSDRTRFTSWEAIPGKHGRTRYKSFDCSIMDLADDIAFGVHDLEDALAMGLMNAEDLRAAIPETVAGCFLDRLKERYPDEFGNDVHAGFIAALADDSRRKRCISRMVHHFVTHVRIETDEDFEAPLLRYRASLPDGQRAFLDALKDAVMVKVIQSASVQHLEFKGQGMVVAVHDALSSDPEKLLPESTRARYEKAEDKPRVICDHIAGMTDGFLLKTYERLFSPRMGSVFDRI